MKSYILVVIASLSLLVPIFVSSTASAEIGYFVTTAPPSYNATYWTVYPRYSTAHVETDAIKVDEDGSTLDLYTSSTGILKWAKTNDFTNTGAWIDPETGSEYATPVGYLPPADATIEYVHVMMAFTAKRPDSVLYISVDNEGSYESSGSITGDDTGLYGIWHWNVTTLFTWTPALINSTNLWVKIATYPDASTHYYLDYLGLFILWSGDYEGGGQGQLPGPDDYPEGDDTSVTFDFDAIFGGGNIVGLMGIAGAIGCIALPAYAVWSYRQGPESKIGLFVKLVASFMFCLTLVMVALGI